MGFFATIFAGILAGWLTEKIMGFDVGIIKNLILGLLGGALGSAVLGLVGMNEPTGIISGVIVSVLGACLIVWLYRLITRRRA